MLPAIACNSTPELTVDRSLRDHIALQNQTDIDTTD
jgi:hypothetical protein